MKKDSTQKGGNTEILKMLVEEVPDALIAISPDGAVIHWNRGASTIFGYSATEAVGKPLSDLIVPDDLLEEEKAIYKNALKKDETTYESFRKRRDGSLVCVTFSTRAIFEGVEKQKVKSFVINLRNVTELKVKRDSKLAYQHFGRVLDAIPDAIVVVNRTGHIVLTNHQTEKMFGYEPDELIGQRLEVLLPPRYRDRHIGHLSSYFYKPHFRAMGPGLELFALRRDNTEFPVEISLSHMETDEGTLAIGAIRDVTDRKKLEVELLKANRELELFGHAVSHDLRAPLRHMVGYAQMALEGKNTHKKTLEYLRRVKEAGEKMNKLIDDLLVLSNLSQGKISMYEVNLTEIAEGIFNQLRQESPDREIVCEVAPGMIVRGDESKLSIVLDNLLRNAWKFTRNQKAPRIEVGVMERDGNLVYFVRDNGAGFDMKYAEKIFTPFQRFHSIQEFEGTGIGLAIVARIIKLHSGIIKVEAKLDEGATFEFTLPGRQNST